MMKQRNRLLVFVSACLLWSPVLFSENDAADYAVAADYSVPAQLSMFTEPQDHPRSGAPQDAPGLVTPANAVMDALDPAEDGSPVAVTEAESETHSPAEEMANLKQFFLQAEAALDDGDYANYFLLADQLEDYPLYPYLQYQWLRKNLDLELQVKHFLEAHKSSRYARLLKNQWLTQLGKEKQWQIFLAFYSKTRDTRMNCYYHRAQFNTGDKQAALDGAKKLWVVGRAQPKACDPLFTQLKKSSHFNRDLFWQRFEAALKNNKYSLAKYVKKLMPVADQKTAELWLKLHRSPERHIPDLLDRPETAQAPLMIMHAINRLASNDINLAVDLWDRNKHRFNISKKQSDKVERRLALQLAYKNESDAYDRLGQLNDSDYKSKTSRIRTALYEQDWSRVLTAINDLSSANQQLEKWQYWLARAYQETGKTMQAEVLLNELADKRDFYGYLAAQSLDRLYQLSNNPVEVTEEEITDIGNHEEFRVAFELMMLERNQEAKLQWWHALRQLDRTDIPAAAKLAQQWQWDEIAIFTIAKVKHWDDIELRFPLSYADKIHENAIAQNLNPVILFGLIRRESAFHKDATSPVGARGLMQIMPKTARQIAKDLRERWHGKDSLYDPVKNLKYGSYYYQKLLKQFDGNYALALAAYNAGPNRVKTWLPDESMPADIWIETIPFRETRDYVTTVLVYAMIYQQRMESNELTMNDLTRDVKMLTSESTCCRY